MPVFEEADHKAIIPKYGNISIKIFTAISLYIIIVGLNAADETFPPEKDIGPLQKKEIYYSTRINEPSDKGKYLISIKPTPENGSRGAESLVEYKFVIYGGIPDGVKGPVRLKIYKSNSSYGPYQLVYDRLSAVKHIDIKPVKVEIPDFLKERSEEFQKKYIEIQKKLAERNSPYWGIPKNHGTFIYQDRLQFSKKNPEIIYYRMFLCKADGTVLKAGDMYKYARIRSFVRRMTRSVTRQTLPYPRRYAQPSSRFFPRKPRSRLPGSAFSGRFESCVIYPTLVGTQCKLQFYSYKPDDLRITGFSIDGIEYPPVFNYKKANFGLQPGGGMLISLPGMSSRKSYSGTYINGKKVRIYNKSMFLNYPFGGNAKLQFEYLTSKGKYKKAEFDFYIPPSPPELNISCDASKNNVLIQWDNAKNFFDRTKVLEVPALVLTRNHTRIADLDFVKQNRYQDRGVPEGTALRYSAEFYGGAYNSSRWTPEKGTETIKVQFSYLMGQSNDKSRYIVIPAGNVEPRPVRIELAKTSLCFENTGVSAAKMLNLTTGLLEREKDMVLYDRASRDYIIDTKYFALSDELKKQFLIKESDYTILLKDYSRDDGNGLELWLFKKTLPDRNRRTDTLFWKIAELPIGAANAEYEKAGQRMIAKIRETLDFISGPDKRKKNIIPKNLICPALTPVNQVVPVWNIDAISESLFLVLGEKNESIKILSKTDWDIIFKERISRNDKGYSKIDNIIREILLRGRTWIDSDGGRKYYFSLCDAFTGEIIGSRIVSGDIRMVAQEVATWISGARLSEDLKLEIRADRSPHTGFRMFHERRWEPGPEFIKNFAPTLMLLSSFGKQKPSAQNLRVKPDKNSGQDFYALVKRQWKDGYRKRAIEMLEDRLKQETTMKTCKLLCEYLKIEKKYKRLLEIYNVMISMDDCPVSVYDSYNRVRNAAKSGSIAAIEKVPDKRRKFPRIYGKETSLTHERIDYSTITRHGKSQKYRNSYVARPGNYLAEYMLGRDRICPEWSPGQPCRTFGLVFKIPGSLLTQGIFSPLANRYGLWMAGCLRDGDSLKYQLFLKNNNTYADFDKGALGRQVAESAPAKKRKSKPDIVVFELGWNSIDPFSLSEDDPRAYTKLGYFFNLYSLSPAMRLLYGYSPVRALFELKKNPAMKMPEYRFYNKLDQRCEIAELKTAGDMIRYIAYTGLRRSGGTPELHELVAIEHLALHGHPVAIKKMNELDKIKIPVTLEEFQERRFSFNILIFQAYRKKTDALKMLNLVLDSKLRLPLQIIDEYIYLMVMADLEGPAGKLACKDNGLLPVGATVLRWAPRDFINRLLTRYRDELSPRRFNYLVFGLRDDEMAKIYLLAEDDKMTRRYFGVSLQTARWNWRREHKEKVRKLAAKKGMSVK